MGYTQPGVSHILKGMEAEFGFPLFIRTRQGVIPTTNAETILPLVRQLLSINEQLEQTISSLNGLTTGRLTIASFASIARNWLPEIIQRFRDNHPDVAVDVQMGSVEEVYDAKELSEAINAFLSSLSYTDRFLFVRRYWYSDSMQDIAAMIGSTANSVAVRLYRLREKLRHHLSKEGLLV